MKLVTAEPLLITDEKNALCQIRPRHVPMSNSQSSSPNAHPHAVAAVIQEHRAHLARNTTGKTRGGTLNCSRSSTVPGSPHGSLYHHVAMCHVLSQDTHITAAAYKLAVELDSFQIPVM